MGGSPLLEPAIAEVGGGGGGGGGPGARDGITGGGGGGGGVGAIGGFWDGGGGAGGADTEVTAGTGHWTALVGGDAIVAVVVDVFFFAFSGTFATATGTTLLFICNGPW